MSWRAILLVLACSTSLWGQDQPGDPTNEKARKTFKEGQELEQKPNLLWALEAFKKANKQDGGHCVACQEKMVKYAIALRDWKTAETAAGELAAEAQGDKEIARAHYRVGQVLLNEGTDRHKDELFTRAHEEMIKALGAYAQFPDAIYLDGLALAHLRQDDAARARFEQYVKMRPEGDLARQRALRYLSQPDLARARMAPAFAVTTTEGKRISLDDLQGKVVLLDFWATWCAPCRAALPHVKDLARKFQGQPLVILSVSLDGDQEKWKEFIAKNEMVWPQYCDGGFTGALARLFDVKAIPHTFTIDADGVLQDEQIGDASEGKIKKLLARARELQTSEKPGR
jgi:thiol-disulfide isomerase/thioredoxin